MEVSGLVPGNLTCDRPDTRPQPAEPSRVGSGAETGTGRLQAGVGRAERYQAGTGMVTEPVAPERPRLANTAGIDDGSSWGVTQNYLLIFIHHNYAKCTEICDD